MAQDDNTPAGASDIVIEAKKRFLRAQEAYSATRTLAVADAKFYMGDSDNYGQWPEEIRNTRKNDKRVCLTVNLTAQHVNQIVNNIRQSRPAVKVSPSDDSADKETASILGGLVRNIQVSSAADDAHDMAAEHAAVGGEGYWRVITDYETPDSFNQVIKIKACPDPHSVFIDPDCKEMDKSDAQWGFIFENITKEQAKREHPEIDPQSWIERSTGGDWFSDETIRRAEYFWCTYEKDTAYLMMDGSTLLKSSIGDQKLVEGVHYAKERKTEVKKWHWCKLVGGHGQPIDQTEWLGSYLPIIAVVGKEFNVAGEITRKGIVRDLKDPARMVNFAYSETVQTLALQNKVPYMAAAEAIEGYEEVWRSANVESRAYLPYNAYDDAGNPLPKPERQMPAVMPAAQVQLLQLSTEEMRGASGQQNSNFGIKSEAQSGIGIQRLKVQGEMATFHFPDNLSRALRYEAKVLIDLIQKYYDTARVVRILGLDGKEEYAHLNPELPKPYHEATDEQGEIARIFNPTVGLYDVVIDTGPNFQTQRQEAFAALTDMAGRNPALMGVAGDLIMRAADFPMADKLAERLAKALPPNLQDEKPGQPQIPPEIQQQVQQMQMQMAHMGAALEEAHKQLQDAKQGTQAEQAKAFMQARLKQQEIQLDADAKREQAAMDARIALEKAEKDAQAKIEIARMEIVAQEEIEEMRGYFELQKAKLAPPSPALTADVEGEFASDEPEEIPVPKIIMRKRIQMMGPSGAMYSGTIHDEPMESSEGVA